MLSRSSTELKYTALAIEAIEILWLQSLLKELKLLHSNSLITFCDNISKNHLATILVLHRKMKYVIINFHFARDFVTKGGLHVRYA